MSRSVIEITTGCAGTGKTFRRCAHFLVDDFLVNESGVHYSNFPIKSKPIVRELLTRKKKVNKSRRQILEQLKVIPQKELDLWADELSGPWNYFKDRDLQDCHISIDEAHNFIGVEHSKGHKAKWKSWLGELRHSGATIEFLTQNEMKLDMCVKRDAEIMRTLENQEKERDPFFSIEMFYWYELRASFLTGQYTVFIKEIDRKRETGNKWVDVEDRLFYRHPKYFKFYDSYNAPQESRKKGEAKKKEYQTRSKIGLLWWFVSRNFNQLFVRFAIVFFILYIMTGGASQIMGYVLSMFSGLTESVNNKTSLVVDDVVADETVETFNSAALLPAPKLPPKSAYSLPGKKIDDNNERAKQYVVNLQDSMVDLVSDNKALKKLIVRESEIVLLTKTSFTLANGFTFLIGEKIDIGFLRGKTAKKIDWSRRMVVFEDGEKIRIGNSRIDSGDFGLSRKDKTETEKSGVSKNLRDVKRGKDTNRLPEKR